MKQIIKLLLCAILFGVSTSAFCADQIHAYKGRLGTALLIDSNGERVVMIAGGAIPNGAATSGDCFAKSNISLKKTPGYYEGDFSPVHNEIVELSSSDVEGKGIGLYLSDNEIKIGGAEVSGICADGVDFSGIYNEVQKNSTDYRNAFLYFMNLAHQDSNYLYRNKDVSGASKELQPFVDNYDHDWLDNADNLKVIIPAINDYAFMVQNLGRNSDAIPLLRIVTQYEPKRIVAWLNMADSYWGENDKANARKCYTKYVDLMTEAGMKAKIPERASNRANSQ